LDDYFAQITEAHRSVDRDAVISACATLEQGFRDGVMLFTGGNGGSAAIANHLLCDYVKGIQTDTTFRPRVISMSANLELMLAIANDICFEDIFLYQVRTMGREGDILMTISSSGNSENIVRAVSWAKDNGLRTIALTGFSGGRSADLADINIHVEAANYGIVEDVHQSIMHIIAQYLRQSEMAEDRIAKSSF
jgi:phosphoheptose isomerase